VAHELGRGSVAANELLEVIAAFSKVVKKGRQTHDPSQSMKVISG